MQMDNPHPVTSHQNHPGETHPAEDPVHQGEDLAALLDRLLTTADKTQKELAAAAGLKYPTLNAWMNRTRGTSRIDPDDLRRMVDVFRSWGVETTPREFFESVGRQVPGPTDQEREARLLKIYRSLPARQQRSLIEIAEGMSSASRVS
jgi:transcriptional regulator with XRE-family HTH domain